MGILIWRDSVSMGDDVDAPHEVSLPLADDTRIDALIATMLGNRYLASIAGGRATWILEGAKPLAVLAQQWTTPRLLVAPETKVAAVRRQEGRPDFEVRYWCQVDPERVFDSLEKGLPLPDRYGG